MPIQEQISKYGAQRSIRDAFLLAKTDPTDRSRPPQTRERVVVMATRQAFHSDVGSQVTLYSILSLNVQNLY